MKLSIGRLSKNRKLKPSFRTTTVNVAMSPYQQRNIQRPQSGRGSNQNLFAPLADQQDTNFVMDEVERGEEREAERPPPYSTISSEPELSVVTESSAWHRKDGWGDERLEPGTISGTRTEEETRRTRPLPPQGHAFQQATTQRERRTPPNTNNDQPM